MTDDDEWFWFWTPPQADRVALFRAHHPGFDMSDAQIASILDKSDRKLEIQDAFERAVRPERLN